jgi:hypothetical protein
MKRIAVLGLRATAVLAGAGILAQACARIDGDEPTDFIRFVELGPGEGRLETAAVTYTKGDVEVDLIAAVHVGDAAYYDRLDERFKGYDAVLYEMIKASDQEVKPGESSGMLSFFQRALKDTLGLEFQLDAVDYAPKNFHHADLDPETFLKLQRDKGESIFSFLLKAMLKDMERQASGKGRPRAGLLDLIAAFSARDSNRSLKLLLAREIEDLESTLSAADGGEAVGASVLIAERNKAAMKALAAALERGEKKVAIFYGAAHMADLERRLKADLGLAKKKEEWLVAWDIAKRKPKAPAGSAKEAPPEEAKQEKATQEAEEKPEEKPDAKPEEKPEEKQER